MKTISIRTSLLRAFVLLIVAVSVTVLSVMFVGARKSIRGLSGQLIRQASDRAEDELETFFYSIESLGSTTRSWIDSGLLNYEGRNDLDRLNRTVAPLLTENQHITSLMLAHDEGFEFMILRDFADDQPYDWLNRVTWADQGSDAAYSTHWPGDFSSRADKPFPNAAEYDVRTRPYYTLPEIGETVWTDPYYFFTTRDAGMTVTTKWRQESGKVRVAAIDLLLMELSQFTVNRKPTMNGRVFVMFRDGSLLGLPADERWPDAAGQREALRNPEERHGKATRADQAATLRTAEELGLPMIEAAVEQWKKAGSGPLDHFRYEVNGDAWWGGFQRFQLKGPELWIGVIAPEDDFLADARHQRNIVLVVCGSALLIAVGIAFFTARRYSQPLEVLASQTERVRNLNLVQEVPVTSRVREINQLAEANAQMMTALDSFARYVPLDLVRQLLRRGEVARIGGKAENLTILFTDIEGFTNLAECMAPDDLTMHMAEYFSALLEVLHDEEATVDKFIGDAIVAFWGAPVPNERHAVHGVRAVLRCRDLLRECNIAWEQRGLPQLRTRFGLSSGNAVVGNVGAPDRLSYTVLGDTVNLASRLEGLNTRYGTEILAAESLVRETGDIFLWREVDRVIVKGKERAVGIAEPLASQEDASDALRELARQYEFAFARYAMGAFAEAEQSLERLLKATPEDGPSKLLLQRCRMYRQNPPEGDWDGVTRFTAK